MRINLSREPKKIKTCLEALERLPVGKPFTSTEFFTKLGVKPMSGVRLLRQDPRFEYQTPGPARDAHWIKRETPPEAPVRTLRPITNLAEFAPEFA